MGLSNAYSETKKITLSVERLSVSFVARLVQLVAPQLHTLECVAFPTNNRRARRPPVSNRRQDARRLDLPLKRCVWIFL